MIRFVPWAEVGTVEVSPGDDVVEVGAFELAEGADTLWVRMTNTGTPGPWPWSYGILSFKTEEGQPLGSIKAYNSYDGEVFRLGVGLPPSVRAGVLTFEPRGFNMAWIRQGNKWSLKFEAQSGDGKVSGGYWSRTPGILSPTNEGDDVNLDSGKLIAESVLTTNEKVRILSDPKIIVGQQFSSGASSRVGIELRGLSADEGSSAILQGTSDVSSAKSAVMVWRGSSNTYNLTYSGSSFFRGSVSTTDLVLQSSDPSLYRTTDDTQEYIGPQLSILDEIVRLEGLVKELYQKLRLVPESGWEVWDGNPDLLQSLGRCNSPQH